MDFQSTAKRPNRTGHGSRQRRNEKHIRHLNSITALKLDEYLEDFKRTFERESFKSKIHDLVWCISPKKPVETQVIDYYKCDLFDLTEKVIKNKIEKNKGQEKDQRTGNACDDENLVHIIKPCFDHNPNLLDLPVEVVNTELPTGVPPRSVPSDLKSLTYIERVEKTKVPKDLLMKLGKSAMPTHMECVERARVPKNLPTKSKNSTICIHALRRSVVIFTPNRSKKVSTVLRNLDNIPLSGAVLKTNRINTIIKLKSEGYACIAHIPPPNYAVYRGIRDYTRKLVEHNILVFQSYNELDYDVTICRRFDCFKRHRVLRGVINKGK